MAEVFGQAPIATPLITEAPVRGGVSPFWLPWFDALVRLVRGVRADVTWNPPNVPAQSVSAALVVSMPGAALGDYVFASFSLSVQALILYGYVNAVDTVHIHLFNPTAGAIDLPSGLLRVYVRPGTL